MSVNNRNGKLTALFPVEGSDQVMLVTDRARLIRCPVEATACPATRPGRGLTLFGHAGGVG